MNVKTDGSFAALKQIDGRLLVVWPAASVWRVTGIRQNWIRDTAARRQMTEPPLHRVTDINDTMANLGRINIEPEFCCCCAGIRGRMFLGPELAMVVKL